jgi:hypothetical protein
MLDTNLIKILALLVTIGTYTLMVYEKGCRDTENTEQLKAKTLQLANDEKIMEMQSDAITQLNYALSLSESTNQSVMEERDAVTKEYNYQNDVITMYQKKLNTTCNPATMELRLIQKLTEPTSSATMLQASTTTSSITNTDRVATNAGILRYIFALREWGINCMNEHNTTIDYMGKR